MRFLNPKKEQTVIGLSVVAAMLFIFSAGCDVKTTTTVSTSSTNTENSNDADTTVNESESKQSNETETKTNEGESTDSEPRTGLLRHAVFFKFKESSSEEDVQRIVDAFNELPSKIPEIIDFQWGTNNSTEGFDDGFTHAFLLTFKDEAGRKTYLPHPAHKAFGKVLGGHNSGVFVIDYWGDPEQPKIDKPLQHCVFFKFKKDADPEAVKKVEEEFAKLPSKINSIKAFEWGKNNSPERHDAGFTHAFLVTFDSEEGRKEYLPHPDHEAFVKVLDPVLEEVRVIDFWNGK